MSDDGSTELRRILELAGIRENTEKVFVLLPRLPAAQMRNLLDRLKAITDDESNWNEITVDGVVYMATGVERDLG